MRRLIIFVSYAAGLQRPPLGATSGLARRAAPAPLRAVSEAEANALADVVGAALKADAAVFLHVSKPADAALKAVEGRVVELKKGRVLQLNYKRSNACDVQRNHKPRGASAATEGEGGLAPKGLSARDAVARVARASKAAHATVGTSRYDVGGGGMVESAVAMRAPRVASHDRAKVRVIPTDAPFLAALNLTNAKGNARPGRERKLRQIFRFAELLDHALARTDVYGGGARLVDMGCGKGYLTFAAHDLLARRCRGDVSVEGIELHKQLVDDSNRAAEALDGLSFTEGYIGECGDVDVVLALHACDTATDDALFAAVSGGAKAILAAPCCHKELRPQLERRRGTGSEADLALTELLRHGVLADRHAEHVTDALRCLALECHGYTAKIIEWISLEHTAKNTMIVATKAEGADASDVRERLRALAAHHGVGQQRLCALLGEKLCDAAPARGRLPQ